MEPIGTNTVATIAYAKMIMADIDDAQMAEQPLGLNHPAWLLLHLCTAGDYAAGLLGGKGVCPSGWNEKADTKKPITTNRADYPSKDELLSVLESSFLNASGLLQKTTADDLNKPQKLGFFETELPTVGDMAAFLLVAHTNLHLGQLSAWRRAIGKGPLF
jgi:hypothetical protein